MFECTCRSVGNPDFGQYAPLSPKVTLQAETLAELKKKVEEYRSYWDLGGGNWVAPVVRKDGKVVGHFSYNGRLWKGAKSRLDSPEILIGSGSGIGSQVQG